MKNVLLRLARPIDRHCRAATVIAWALVVVGVGLWIYGVVERGLPVLGTALAFGGTAVGARVIEAGRRND